MRTLYATIVSMAMLTGALAGCMGAENRVDLDPGAGADVGPLGETGPAVTDPGLDQVDEDRDGIPDALEAEICSRAGPRKILDDLNRDYQPHREEGKRQAEAIAGSTGKAVENPMPKFLGVCRSDTDLEVFSVHQRIFVPTGLISGPDKDRDGLPEWIDLVGLWVTVDTKDRTRVATWEPGTFEHRLWLDSPNGAAALGDDSDPDKPLLSIIQVPLVPIGYDVGPDADGDGFPAHVSLLFADLTIDRRLDRDGGLHMTWSPSFEVSVTVDPDDADPDQPVDSTVKIPAPLPNGKVTMGPDKDGDDIPRDVTIGMSHYTVHRTAKAEVLVATGVGPAVVPLITQQEAKPLVAPLDDEPFGDDADYDRPVEAKISVSVPMAAQVGPDHDGDGLPSDLTLHFLVVTIDRRSHAVGNQPVYSTATINIVVDEDDERDDTLVVNMVDGNRNLFPDALEPTMCDWVVKKGDDTYGTCSQDGQRYDPPWLPRR